MSTYEDIKALITRLDSIAKAPEYQPFPEADEEYAKIQDGEYDVIKGTIS